MEFFKLLFLNSEEKKAYREAKKAKSVVTPEPVVPPPVKHDTLLKKVIYSNRNITVIFHSAIMLSKSDVGLEFLERIKACTTEQEVLDLMVEKVVVPPTVPSDFVSETKEEREIVSHHLAPLENHPEFEVNGNQVVMKGVSLPLTAPVIASFIQIIEKQEGLPDAGVSEDDNVKEFNTLKAHYQALKMFWLKIALNPLPASREQLLTFVRKNKVRITPNGNLVLYRRVVSKQGADTKLVTFVTQNYYDIKKQDKLPENYAISKKGDEFYLVYLPDVENGAIPEGTEFPFANLRAAYEELPEQGGNRFTAAHDKSVDIRLGAIYKIKESGINLDNGVCAAGGLHAAAVDYNYSGYGDLPVVVLVNPSKAITVPIHDNGKLRTTEMFVACVNDKPQGTHFDDSALSAFDTEYHDLTLAELEKAVSTKSFEDISVKEELPAVSLVDVKHITAMLRNRVQVI